MEIVKIQDTYCNLKFGYYKNKTVAIHAFRVSDNELWNVLTINYQANYQGRNYTLEMVFPVIVIKNYDLNDGVYQDLLDAKVIHQGPYLSGSNGGVQIGVLTDKWATIAKEQLDESDDTN